MKKIIYILLLVQSGFLMAQTETVVTTNGKKVEVNPYANNCLLYTSDAADDQINV